MYKLNTEAAKKADVAGAFINETGKYIGVFTRAEKLVSPEKGTHGIGFTLKTDAGQTTRFDVWTLKSDNQPLSGLNQVNAIMACLKVQELTVAKQAIMKWDNNARTDTLQQTDVFPELMNKPIGVLLRSEEYEKMQSGRPTGETAWKMSLYMCFQADTELMASEILAQKTKPEQLGKVILLLADKPLKKKTTQVSQQPPAPNFSDYDPDIPF